MADDYAAFLLARRDMLGLSQRELARLAGVQQPTIAAIERGRRLPTPAVRAALAGPLAIRPSRALAARREAVRRIFLDASLPEPRVFGSVARGDDTEASDLDLLVEFDGSHDIADLLELEERLEQVLTVHADIVDARADGPVIAQATREAVAL